MLAGFESLTRQQTHTHSHCVSATTCRPAVLMVYTRVCMLAVYFSCNCQLSPNTQVTIFQMSLQCFTFFWCISFIWTSLQMFFISPHPSCSVKLICPHSKPDVDLWPHPMCRAAYRHICSVVRGQHIPANRSPHLCTEDDNSCRDPSINYTSEWCELRDVDETGFDQIFGKCTIRVLSTMKKKRTVLSETSISKYAN